MLYWARLWPITQAILAREDSAIDSEAINAKSFCKATLLVPRSRFHILVATVAGAGHGARFTVHAPLLELTKAEIIHRGIEPGVDYRLTHSCYDPTPDGPACGDCDSCTLRRRGFDDAGVPDRTRNA